MQNNNPNFNRRPPRELPAKPRRVRGGLKLSGSFNDPEAGPIPWAAQRWIRLVEQAASGPRLVEGLDYARQGQTRRLEIDSGAARASVQGRAFRAYETTLAVEPFSHEQWERVIETMADQAVYAAKLLAGDLPANIEDLFIPLGLQLFPAGPADVKTTCTCGHAEPWCKHACCVAVLLAEQLGADPFLMFQLRGISSQDLLERLTQRRAVVGAGDSSVPVYVAGGRDSVFGGDYQPPTLEEAVQSFWDLGAPLNEVDLPLEPPSVSHPLLRRLGPSPFPGAKFPMVGLLATCYEMVSKAALTIAEPPSAGEGLVAGAADTEAPGNGPQMNGPVDASTDVGAEAAQLAAGSEARASSTGEPDGNPAPGDDPSDLPD